METFLEMPEHRRKKRRSRYRLESTRVPTPVQRCGPQPQSLSPVPGAPGIQLRRHLSDAQNSFTYTSPSQDTDRDPCGSFSNIVDQSHGQAHGCRDQNLAPFLDESVQDHMQDDSEHLIPSLQEAGDVEWRSLIPEADDRFSSPSEMTIGNGALYINNWRVLWGLIVTNGSLKLTKHQYQTMPVVADTFRRLSDGALGESSQCNSMLFLRRERVQSLPHYSTLFKVYKPLLYRSLAVRGFQTLEKVCVRRAGAHAVAHSDW